MWDPINSTTTDTCAWGLGGVDAPVPGIDRNNDVYSDMVTYRGQTWGYPLAIETIATPALVDAPVRTRG